MGLQTLWPCSLMQKPHFSDLGCSSGHVLSKTMSVTPHFYISGITNSSSYNGKSLTEKSMLDNFRANVLNSHTFTLFFLLITLAYSTYYKFSSHDHFVLYNMKITEVSADTCFLNWKVLWFSKILHLYATLMNVWNLNI